MIRDLTQYPNNVDYGPSHAVLCFACVMCGKQVDVTYPTNVGGYCKMCGGVLCDQCSIQSYCTNCSKQLHTEEEDA